MGTERAGGIVARMLESIGELCCGLQGHTMMTQFERNRLFLQCASCGRQSPGWTLAETPPKRALRGDARRHVPATPQLIRARRVA